MFCLYLKSYQFTGRVLGGYFGIGKANVNKPRKCLNPELFNET